MDYLTLVTRSLGLAAKAAQSVKSKSAGQRCLGCETRQRDSVGAMTESLGDDHQGRVLRPAFLQLSSWRPGAA